MSLPRRAFLVGAAGLAGCAALPEPRSCPAAGGRIRVVSRSWHTEIAVPAASMGSFAATYRGAAWLMLGFGKRNFMTAPARGLSEWLAGPFAGPGIMQVTALSVPPEEAMAATVLTLPLDDAGLMRLADSLWDSFRLTGEGHPAFVSHLRGSDFYEAAEGYSLDHTCNTWTARKLATAGFPVRSEGAVLAGEVMRQVAALPAACRPTLARS
ncbi:DUF2459 domain-containing protein [Roseococcus sp. SYP-B2431]|uniref:DUF2459 domain-containing protein n=1 Tax=Roseococcus sp. SYP-B2431 TaxID=2496640 RepID=UPI0013F3B106|nr:DUF2459 domain-containing protein [Roseococcus sp. SYP-B2431]